MEKEKIKKFKTILNKTKLEIEQRYNEISLFLDFKNKLGNIDNIDILLDFDFEILVENLNKMDFEYDLNTLNTSIYFYNCGKQYSNFKETSRYIDSSKYLASILNKIKSFFLEANLSQDIDVLNSQKDIINDLLQGFKDDKFIGMISSLYDYDFIFQYNETVEDEEKIEFYSLLIEGYSDYLISIEETMREDILMQEEAELAEKEKEILKVSADDLIDEEVEANEILDENITDDESVVTIEKTHLTLTDEEKMRLEYIKEESQNRKKLIQNISDVRIQFFKNIMQSITTSENSIDVIKNTMNLTDFKLFIIFMLNEMVEDVLFAIKDEYSIHEIDEAKDMVFMDISSCEEYINLILEIEKEQSTLDVENTPVLSEEKEMQLIFYENQSGVAELEKNIKDFSEEKLENCWQLIEQLQEGRIELSRAIAGGTDMPTMYEIHKGKLFITFRKMPNNHILVYHASHIEHLTKQKTDEKLSAISVSKLKEIKNIINDEGIEYRKLIARNIETLTRIREKCVGSKEYK